MQGRELKLFTAACIALALLALLGTVKLLDHDVVQEPSHSVRRRQVWGVKSLARARRTRPEGTFTTPQGLEFPEYLREWVGFAAAQRCALDSGYATIEHDIRPFLGRRWSRADLAAVSATIPYINICKVRGGAITCAPFGLEKNSRVYQMDPGFRALVRQLPDMDLLLSAEDSPRVLIPMPDAPPFTNVSELRVFDLGPETSLMERCANATGVRAAEGLHTMFLRNQPARVEQPVPVLSPSRIEGCHLDLVLPTWTSRPSHVERPAHASWWCSTPQPDYVDWDHKLDEVQWKGRTTGADVVPGAPWDRSQRFRLVEDLNRGQYFGREVAANVAFVGIVQCDEVADAELCRSICQRYRCADPEPGLEQFWAKYIVDVDGNAWSQRFEQLLLSGSVILKMTLHRTWWEERALPWVHYVPIDIDLSNLNSTVQWLHTHPEDARRIGAAGRELALSRLRDADLDCYILRLLLDYHFYLLDPADD